MPVLLGIVQILLAVAFVGAGLLHATQGKNPPRGMEWMSAVPVSNGTAAVTNDSRDRIWDIQVGRFRVTLDRVGP